MVLERLMEIWLDSAREHLRESTVVSYRIAVARAVRYLGAREIASLSEADLKDAEQQLAANGDSYQTARLMFNVIRLSLDYAVGQGMLAVNPAKDYSPRKELYRKTKGAKAASTGDVARLLKKYKFLHPYHMPSLLLYEAGLRSGEVLGLTWDHVDLKESTLHVTRQLVQSTGGKYKFTPLRSKNLVRDIRIDGKLKEQLARWRRDQKNRGLLRKKDSFVCVETDGSPIDYHRFAYMMRKEGFTPQSLRKFYEDKAREAVAILKERFSLKEIGILQTQMLRKRENVSSEKAFSLPLEGKVSAERLTDEVGIA